MCGQTDLEMGSAHPLSRVLICMTDWNRNPRSRMTVRMNLRNGGDYRGEALDNSLGSDRSGKLGRDPALPKVPFPQGPEGALCVLTARGCRRWNVGFST
jgi:hypothetical protein